jgi:ATP-dependent RNA circularization protein (DNA/RNA ligase family)
VSDTLIKFPRTPHLAVPAGTVVRGDKVLSAAEARRLLGRVAVAEEKVDGANLGLSLGRDGRVRAQSRGHYLASGHVARQFAPLAGWMARREPALAAALQAGLVLYGEWCYARHTVAYDSLPDWFLLFDVLDRATGRFWSRERRDALASRLGLSVVPFLGQGRFDLPGLERLLGRSRLGREPMEGLYLRWDDGPWLDDRAKLVRAGWAPAGDEHWSKRTLETNRLDGRPPGK